MPTANRGGGASAGADQPHGSSADCVCGEDDVGGHLLAGRGDHDAVEAARAGAVRPVAAALRRRHATGGHA